MADESAIDWSALGDSAQPASSGTDGIDWSAVEEPNDKQDAKQASVGGVISKILSIHSPSEDAANEANAARAKGIGEYANHITGGLTQLANSATFGLEPKLNAGLLHLLSGKPYDQAQQEVTSQDEQYARENPATASNASYGWTIPTALLAALFPESIGGAAALGIKNAKKIGSNAIKGAAQGYGMEQMLGRDKTSSLLGALGAGQ